MHAAQGVHSAAFEHCQVAPSICHHYHTSDASHGRDAVSALLCMPCRRSTSTVAASQSVVAGTSQSTQEKSRQEGAGSSDTRHAHWWHARHSCKSCQSSELPCFVNGWHTISDVIVMYRECCGRPLCSTLKRASASEATVFQNCRHAIYTA